MSTSICLMWEIINNNRNYISIKTCVLQYAKCKIQTYLFKITVKLFGKRK